MTAVADTSKIGHISIQIGDQVITRCCEQAHLLHREQFAQPIQVAYVYLEAETGSAPPGTRSSNT